VTFLLIFVGGAIGAPSRYLLDRFIQNRHRHPFPIGTLAVNVMGCILLGIVTAGVAKADWSAELRLLIGTGFCGCLTTFSTFSAETVELLQGRRPLSAIGYLVLSCGLGIGGAALGYAAV
jgi:CrcB protein